MNIQEKKTFYAVYVMTWAIALPTANGTTYRSSFKTVIKVVFLEFLIDYMVILQRTSTEMFFLKRELVF